MARKYGPPKKQRYGPRKTQTICSIPGCGDQYPFKARGLCRRHYLQWWRGHPRDQLSVVPLNGRSKRIPAIDRIVEYVAQGSGDAAACWDWTGYKSPLGYGCISTMTPKGWRQTRAHRVTYEHVIGPIPKGLFLCHFLGCKCVNPWHCAPGTRSQNSHQDRIHRAATRAGRPLFTDPYEVAA